MLASGQIAPEFKLLNQAGQPVSSSDLRGSWVVLYFYPRDDTPGCTVEACEFTAGIEAFQGLNARVFGVSPDSVASHAKFIHKHALRVELLSDPDHSMLERYGAWGEKSMYGKRSFGVLRSTVIIDPAGRIAKHWPKVQAAGHAAAVEAALAELQGAKASPRTPTQIASAAPSRASKQPKVKPTATSETAAKPVVGSKTAKKPTRPRRSSESAAAKTQAQRTAKSKGTSATNSQSPSAEALQPASKPTKRVSAAAKSKGRSKAAAQPQEQRSKATPKPPRNKVSKTASGAKARR
jgi:thioredoxin-dependent peroxiredoxin